MFLNLPQTGPQPATALLRAGEQTFDSVELEMQVPLFLVTLSSSEGDDTRQERILIVSDFRLVQRLVDGPEEGTRVSRVELLSPGAVNGTTSFQLSRLQEVWVAGNEQIFVLDDGREIRFRPCSARGKVRSRRVLALP